MGRSNVGKSSLINALCQMKTALTSKHPGRTQMANFYALNNLRLVDLPGYGYSSASKQKQDAFAEVLTEYLADRTNLRCPVLIVDARRVTTNDEACFAAASERFARVLVAVNKTDTLNMKESHDLQNRVARSLGANPSDVFLLSAKSGRGVNDLLRQIRAVCLTA